MNEPEDDGIHVHRCGVLCQGLLGAESGSLDTLVNDGYDVVDDRNDQEESGPFTPRNLPARRITNFCQGTAPGTKWPSTPSTAAMATQAIARNTVIGFIFG